MDDTRDLALDVLGLARQLLLVRMRFLEPALYRLALVPDESATFAVDGRELRFSPRHVLERYLDDERLVTRDYLHAVLHCVFSHPFVGADVASREWDLACDIAVESLIAGLDIDAVRSRRDQEQAETIERLADEVGTLSAERIYRHLLKVDVPASELARLERLFAADDHTPWYGEAAEAEEQQASESEHTDEADDEQSFAEEGDDGAPAGEHDDERDGEQPQRAADDGTQPDQAEPSPSPDEHDDGRRDAQVQERPTSPDDPDADDEDAAGAQAAEERRARAAREGGGASPGAKEGTDGLAAEWKQIAERMQVEMDTFGSQGGTGTRDLVEAIHALNRQRYDYADFLRRFATFGEEMTLSPDEFDYVYYTYGLRLYHNMPLVEPLEYQERRGINEFVIAIDTSASVEGDLVQAFIEKTFDMLKQSESFLTKVKVYVIQCDAEIKDVQVLTSLDQVDDLMASWTLRGFGGTDFRPVFAYVDELIARRELTDLKGLVYFTDGYGTFPAKMPSYRTAFVFLDDGRSNPDVPPWATKLILDEGDL